MESFDTREAITDLTLDLLSQPEFADGPSAGIVLQAYLTESPEHLDAPARLGREHPAHAPVRDPPGQGRLLGPRGRPGRAERLGAAGLHRPPRVRPQLRAADATPDRRHADRPGRDRLPQPALDLARRGLRGRRGVGNDDLEFQILRGLGDDTQAAIAATGRQVRAYCPVGDLVAGMAYLVRRLLENTANDSFLAAHASGTDTAELLEARETPSATSRCSSCAAPAVRTEALDALAALDAKLPLEVPMLIGEDVVHGQRFASVDPATRRPDRRQRARRHRRARQRRHHRRRARPATWSQRPASERAAALSRAAGILRSRRYELAALAVREAGKPWAEADGDVAEAIDFLEYYAQGALALDNGRPLIQMPGERNAHALRRPRHHRRDRAVELPARDRRRHGLRRAGDRQRRHPQARRAGARVRQGRRRRAARRRRPARRAVASSPAATSPARRWSPTRASTRSSSPAPCAAGLNILQTANTVVPGQRHIKHVIAEMGGKNCVIVDSDADLDDVVPGLLKSAFAFAGQKCSAASRALIHRPSPTSWPSGSRAPSAPCKVGPASDFGTDVPPVIDIAAQQRIQSYIDSATPLAQGDTRDDGFYVAADALPRPARPTTRSSRRRSSARCSPSRRVDSVEHACELVDQSRVRAHRRPLQPLPAHDRVRRPSARRSATSTSTARSRARWSAASRSAAGACPAPARRPAARTTCCSSSRPARCRRTPCATASSCSARWPRRRSLVERRFDLS